MFHKSPRWLRCPTSPSGSLQRRPGEGVSSEASSGQDLRFPGSQRYSGLFEQVKVDAGGYGVS